MTSYDSNDRYYNLTLPQTAVFSPATVVNRKVSILFRLSRPRTWAFPTISLILGYSAVGGDSMWGLLLGIIVACLITAATNLVNAYADRREDIVNQPSRALWLDKIGPSRAVAVAVLLYGAGLTVAVEIGGLFTVVLCLGILNSLFYSLPPLRFKANPVRSEISFSGAVGLAFLGGMSIAGPIDVFNPLFWLCTYFMLTYGTVKNLPDFQGDRRAGIRTSATIFGSIKDAIMFSSMLLSTPYLLLVGLVIARVIGAIYLLDLGFAIVLSLILRQMWRTMNPEGLEKAHTVAFFYAISFLMFTLVLTSPTIPTLAVVMGACAWTLLMSKINVDSRVERRDWDVTINT